MIVAEVAFPWTNTCPSALDEQSLRLLPTTAARSTSSQNCKDRDKGGRTIWALGVLLGTEFQAVSGVMKRVDTASFFGSNGTCCLWRPQSAE